MKWHPKAGKSELSIPVGGNGYGKPGLAIASSCRSPRIFKSMKFIHAFALSILLMSSSSIAADFPLTISNDGRKIVDQNGEAFFINGDTAWSLIGQVSKEDADLYLQDCAARGINSVIVTLVEGFYADNAPANFYDVQPFTTPNNFTTPNEEYFAHADWVINKAAEYGILMVIAPAYLGCCDDGWLSAVLNDNSDANMRWYGEWIGNRYRDYSNIMYVWGNDMNPGSARSRIREMAEGVKSSAPGHLQTFHASPPDSALDQWSASEIWMDVNTTYTYDPIHTAVLRDYNRTPFLPFFLFESQYEGDFLNASAMQTRKQAYVAVLSGAQGHHYGNFPIWHMNGAPSNKGDDWKNHLDDEGRADVEHVGSLFLSRNWATLIPDQNHEVVTAGFFSGQDYVAAAKTSDSSTAIVYFPRMRDSTIDLDTISGSQKNAWWFNPRDGSATVFDLSSSSGSLVVSPPSSGDWVLVIDDAAANLPEPGSNMGTVVRPNPPSDLRAE